jgi:hypothetical protein
MTPAPGTDVSRSLVQRAVKDFDDRRLRAAKAYDDALATVKTFSAEVSRLIKQSNRKSSSTTADRLAANEARLAPAQAALDKGKRELDTLDAGRAEEIEKAIEQSPDFIPKNDSLIARVKALFEEMQDPWVAVPMAIFDAIIVGIDIVILTLKAIAMPSTYGMRDTRRHLREMAQQARLADAETEVVEHSPGLAPPDDHDPPDPPNDHSGMNGAPPPRRRRGRPRKNPVVRPINGATHTRE